MSGSIHNLQAKRRLQAKKNAMINNTHKVYAHSDFHATITAVTTITSKEYKSKDLLVPRAGIEPARCRQRGILSPVRLPIPPPGLFELCITASLRFRYYSKLSVL